MFPTCCKSSWVPWCCVMPLTSLGGVAARYWHQRAWRAYVGVAFTKVGDLSLRRPGHIVVGTWILQHANGRKRERVRFHVQHRNDFAKRQCLVECASHEKHGISNRTSN